MYISYILTDHTILYYRFFKSSICFGTYLCILVKIITTFLTLYSPFHIVKRSDFRAQEPKAPVTYCDHALSGVRRPSVVRCPLDNLHFQLLLENCLIDFDETWYG